MKKAALWTWAVLGVAAVVGTHATSRAGDPPQTQPGKQFILGSVVRLDGEVLVVKNRAGIELKVQTNKDTLVFVDGAGSTLESLSPGQRIRAAIADGVATRIDSLGKPPP